MKNIIFILLIAFIYPSYLEVESQISSISDDIAYNSHDLEDGLKAGLFQIEQLDKIPIISDIIYKLKKKLKMKDKDLVLRQII